MYVCTHAVIHAFIHAFLHPLMNSPINSLTYSGTHSLIHSRTGHFRQTRSKFYPSLSNFVRFRSKFGRFQTKFAEIVPFGPTLVDIWPMWSISGEFWMMVCKCCDRSWLLGFRPNFVRGQAELGRTSGPTSAPQVGRDRPVSLVDPGPNRPMVECVRDVGPHRPDLGEPPDWSTPPLPSLRARFLSLPLGEHRARSGVPPGPIRGRYGVDARWMRDRQRIDHGSSRSSIRGQPPDV